MLLFTPVLSLIEIWSIFRLPIIHDLVYRINGVMQSDVGLLSAKVLIHKDAKRFGKRQREEFPSLVKQPRFKVQLNPIWTGLFANLKRLGGGQNAPLITWLF